MIDLVISSFWETIGMVAVSGIISVVLGVPLAVFIYVRSSYGLRPSQLTYGIAGFLVNGVRSIPYIIMMVLLMPLTRFLVGTTIGMWAAAVPLAIAGTLILARLCEDGFRQIDRGLIEFGRAYGATDRQIIVNIILSESLPIIISSVTTVMVSLIGFSAMAGAVGGGGLGDLAIRYGYQRYELELLVYIVIILVVMVQSVQMVGDWLAAKLRK